MIPGSTEEQLQQTRLDTWKSIAEYLGRSCRTVQRWHREYALPVRHVGGGSGSVFAYDGELDVWMRARGSAEEDESLAMRKATSFAPALKDQDPPPHGAIVASGAASSPARSYSAELTALAFKMWEDLSHGSFNGIARSFREAIDIDPGNALAFGGLANALIAQGCFGTVFPQAAYASAQAAVQRAREIDPELFEAQCAAAWLKLLSTRDWKGARSDFDRMLAHRPQCAPALAGRALLHIAGGCASEASVLLFKAAAQNAFDTSIASLYCWSEYLKGEYARALEEIEHLRAGGGSGPIVDAVEALASIRLDGPHASIPRIEVLAAESPRHWMVRGVLGYACALAGQSRKANEILDSATNAKLRSKSREPYAVALVLIGLKENAKALKWLMNSYHCGSLWSLGFPIDPILAPLRDDTHFRPFWNHVSYPDADNPSPTPDPPSDF